MIDEYRTFKKNLVKSFDFKAPGKSTHLGRLNVDYDESFPHILQHVISQFSLMI